jgi:hypothetical protein
MSRRQSGKPKRGSLLGGTLRSDDPNTADEPFPDVEKARLHAEAQLPKDPTTGKIFPRGCELAAFQTFGLSIFAYMTLLEQWFFSYGVVLLLSMSSMVHNAYGHMLDSQQASLQTYLFTFTSLGNSDEVSPVYGASELIITCVLTGTLYWSIFKLRVMTRRAERLQLTPADYAVKITGLPKNVSGAAVKLALWDEKEKRGALADYQLYHHASEAEDSHREVQIEEIGVALTQRDTMLKIKQYDGAKQVLEAQEKALAEWAAAKAKKGQLSNEGAKWEEKLKEAYDKGRAALETLSLEVAASVTSGGELWQKASSTKLAKTVASDKTGGEVTAEAKTAALDLNKVWSCAGTAFVSFTYASDAVELLRRKTLEVTFDQRDLPADHVKTTYTCALERPPEPSDIIWENLECEDGRSRQWRGTFYMLLLSMSGTAVITVTSYMQPKALDRTNSEAANAFVGLIGTVLVVGGYLVVFLVVPNVEENFMRHKTTTQREVSTVLKLVLFQVLATIGTASVFVIDAGGSFNREWYMLGGFILINGMIVDAGFITCVVQGWNLGVQIARRVVAPRALTQFEADQAYAVKADGYVVDRLQMVTKFIVMTYIYSSVMPLLWGIVVFVVFVSNYLDRRNLLRVFCPAPHSDESAVKAILVYVMPLAILMHLLVSYVMVSAMVFENQQDWIAAQLENMNEMTTTILATVGLSNATVDDESPDNPFSYIGNVTFDDVVGAFTDPSRAAFAMVRLSVFINGPLVLLFILREWGREAGRELPLDVLLQAPGTAIGLGANVVKKVGARAPSLLPRRLRKALYEEVEGAMGEAQAVMGVLGKRLDEEHMALDDATLRFLEEDAAEIQYEGMITRCMKQWGESFTKNSQLYYKPPDYEKRLALIKEIVSSGHLRRGNTVVLNSAGSPIKMPKGRPPSRGAPSPSPHEVRHV